MKPRWFGIAVRSLLLVAFVAGVFVWWEHTRLIYPTPESESVFLKNYTPLQVIDHFREPNESYSYGQHAGAGAGRPYVTHTAGFDPHIVLRRDKWEPLMSALHDDVLQQLAKSGAEVLSQTGTACDGFHFEYKIGKSIGSLTISPVAITPPSEIHRNMRLPQCLDDVTVNIEQSEKWFPNGVPISVAGAVR